MKWDHRFMTMARQIRTWAGEQGVGAVIVSPDKKQISIGYSGFPSGIDCDVADRDAFTVHAEINALLNARCDLRGWTLYSTKALCSHCAIAAIQAGIARIVALAPEPESRWFGTQIAGAAIIVEAAIVYDIYQDEPDN